MTAAPQPTEPDRGKPKGWYTHKARPGEYHGQKFDSQTEIMYAGWLDVIMQERHWEKPAYTYGGFTKKFDFVLLDVPFSLFQRRVTVYLEVKPTGFEKADEYESTVASLEAVRQLREETMRHDVVAVLEVVQGPMTVSYINTRDRWVTRPAQWEQIAAVGLGLGTARQLDERCLGNEPIRSL